MQKGFCQFERERDVDHGVEGLMMHQDQTTKREAILTETVVEGHSTRALYRWNTGEISQISVPVNFFFDPSKAIRPRTYSQSAVATQTQVD